MRQRRYLFSRHPQRGRPREDPAHTASPEGVQLGTPELPPDVGTKIAGGVEFNKKKATSDGK